jgi:hypothetical protein
MRQEWRIPKMDQDASNICWLLRQYRNSRLYGIPKQLENRLVGWTTIAVLIDQTAGNDKNLIAIPVLRRDTPAQRSDCLGHMDLGLAKGRDHDAVATASTRIHDYVERPMITIDAPRTKLRREPLAQIQVLAYETLVFRKSGFEVVQQLLMIPGHRRIGQLGQRYCRVCLANGFSGGWVSRPRRPGTGRRR